MGCFFVFDPYENRTRVCAVRGRCLSRLTNGPFQKLKYYTTDFRQLQYLFSKKFFFFESVIKKRADIICIKGKLKAWRTK